MPLDQTIRAFQVAVNGVRSTPEKVQMAASVILASLGSSTTLLSASTAHQFLGYVREAYMRRGDTPEKQQSTLDKLFFIAGATNAVVTARHARLFNDALWHLVSSGSDKAEAQSYYLNQMMAIAQGYAYIVLTAPAVLTSPTFLGNTPFGGQGTLNMASIAQSIQVRQPDEWQVAGFGGGSLYQNLSDAQVTADATYPTVQIPSPPLGTLGSSLNSAQSGVQNSQNGTVAWVSVWNVGDSYWTTNDTWYYVRYREGNIWSLWVNCGSLS